MIRITSTEMKFITLFEKMTGSTVKDCIVNGDELTFIIKQGEMGLAIGKKGAIINRIKKEIGKEIHIYEHADDAAGFIRNLFYPIKIDSIEVDGNEVRVFIDAALKKRAIGKGGKKINTVKELASRHFGITSIKIM
jgi:N utilization substance protein A